MNDLDPTAAALPLGACTDEPEAVLSAAVVLVPEAEPVVGVTRARYDRSGRWGVPAHVTVLFPFVPPTEQTPEVYAALDAALAVIAPFPARFERTAWFGEDVVYLVPEPDAAFRRLLGAVQAAFPAHPAYGGAFDDVVPHVTVADLGTLARRQQAQQQAQAGLPITSRVAAVHVIAGRREVDSWRIVHVAPLGGAGIG